MTQPYTLNPERVGIIKQVLIPFAGKIECVGVFGSHALRTARPNSDIDLVMYGELEDADVDRTMRLLFTHDDLQDVKAA